MRGVAAVTATFALMLTGLAGSANAQGSATGLVFMSHMTDGAVWVGDIGANPAAHSVFWQAAGSAIDQVAVTDTMVAWSSAFTEDTQYQNRVFLAPIGRTAENVVTVTFPYLVQGLASDQTGEKFFVLSDGKIFILNSDGTGKTEIVSDQSNLIGSYWALAIDTTNHKIYATNDENGELFVYQLDSNNMNGDSGTLLLQVETLINSDGLWIDTPGNRIVWTGYNDNYGVHQVNLDGSNYQYVVDTSSIGTAPTGMIISNSTSKMYFTVEEKMIETDLSGNNPRVLYESGYNSSGFEGFAIAFGITMPEEEDPAPTITLISPDSGPIAGGTTVTITGTGFQNGATVKIGGVTCAIVSVTATQIVCTTGAHAAGDVNVRVENTDEQYDVLTDGFTYEGNGGGGNGGGDPEPGSVVKFSKTVFFGGDSSAISSVSKKVLNKIVSRIPDGATNVKITVSSFVKKAKSEVKGSALANARAKKVVNYLKNKFADATYKSVPNGKGSSTSNSARKAVIKVTYTTPVG